jgi:hypothetical protein
MAFAEMRRDFAGISWNFSTASCRLRAELSKWRFAIREIHYNGSLADDEARFALDITAEAANL